MFLWHYFRSWKLIKLLKFLPVWDVLVVLLKMLISLWSTDLFFFYSWDNIEENLGKDYSALIMNYFKWAGMEIAKYMYSIDYLFICVFVFWVLLDSNCIFTEVWYFTMIQATVNLCLSNAKDFFHWQIVVWTHAASVKSAVIQSHQSKRNSGSIYLN